MFSGVTTHGPSALKFLPDDVFGAKTRRL